MGNEFLGALGGVLGNVYQSIHKQTFLQTGLSAYQLGQYPGKLHFDTKPMSTTGLCQCGKCKQTVDMAGDYTTIAQSSECWLTERVEKVRLYGKNWNRSIKRISAMDYTKKAPPGVGGEMIPLTAGTGIPVKTLRNGDKVYVYPPDHYVPDEVLEKWKASNASRVESNW